MADLREEGACDLFAFPMRIGGAALSVIAAQPMISIAPFRDRIGEVEGTLGTHLSVGLPATGKAQDLSGGRIFWTGAEQWFLRAPEIPEALRNALGEDAAVTDQSDAWTGLVLEGAAVAEVMARLVPVDFEAQEPRAALRTMLGHMMCALVVTEEGVEIWVMRSFSLSAVHEIETAMRRVAGIAVIGSAR